MREFTRSEFIQGGKVSKSCIDHIYTNAPRKISKPEVVAVGTSDHLGVIATKYTRAPILKPKVVLKRSYKAFNVENFLRDINCSDINNVVTALDNVEDAAREFENKFRLILDQHAPLKVFQTRKNFSPYLSESTKSMMAARNSWKETAG